tara:strand:- start:3915 stop:4256 length:342 start_codon:yes stop_codon:yes gene_type:complete
MREDGTGGFLSSNENLGSLRDGVRQLILTSRGARVMRPDYGTDIRKSVFNPLDNTMINTLREQIVSTIATYEKRVIVKKLTLVPDEENHKLIIKLLITSKDDLLNAAMVEVLV